MSRNETADPTTKGIHYEFRNESFDRDGFTFSHKAINEDSSRSGGGIELLEYDIIWTVLGDPDDREWNEGGPEKLARQGIMRR